MKIDQSTIAMSAMHTQSRSLEVSQRVQAWVDSPPPAEAPPPPKDQSLDVPPELQIAKKVVEIMTGRQIKTIHPSDTQPAAQPEAPRAGFGVDIQSSTTYSESEQAAFTASGVINTADGQQISFDLGISMSRQFTQTSSERIHIGDAARKQDPLVINFGGSAAQLSSQRFAFDLNSDGKIEHINFPTSGSGFLVLDKTGSGKVTDGSQLFGTKTGNGFAELALYDKNGNGWIDENDPVYQQLKIWTKSSTGQDQLTDLKSAGVGAISLKSIDTPFDIKNAANQTQASVRQSGIYLSDSGKAGTVQQIDLTV